MVIGMGRLVMSWIATSISVLLIIGIGLLAGAHGFWAGVLAVIPIKMLTATWIIGASDGQLAEMSKGMMIGSLASVLFAVMVLMVVKNEGNYWQAMLAGASIWASVVILGRMI